jgi:hypothetical protein
MGEPIDGPDSAELDAVKELLASPGWGLVAERIRTEIERRRNALEGDLEVVATVKARGGLAALRMVLELPGILRQELERVV